MPTGNSRLLKTCVPQVKNSSCFLFQVKKKILDFYHRSCLSAYCTAFAYRPLTFNFPKDHCLKDYLQVNCDVYTWKLVRFDRKKYFYEDI